MESGTSVRNYWSVKLIVLTEGNVTAHVDALKGVLKQKLDQYNELSTSSDRVKFSWKVEETSLFGDIRLTTQPGNDLSNAKYKILLLLVSPCDHATVAGCLPYWPIWLKFS